MRSARRRFERVAPAPKRMGGFSCGLQTIRAAPESGPRIRCVVVVGGRNQDLSREIMLMSTA
jgi:hypothetical protein